MCRADNRNLWPLMSADKQGVFAISCTVCDFIGGDGSSVADAITTWNNEARAAVSETVQLDMLKSLLTCAPWRVTVRDDKEFPPQGTETAF